MGIFVKISSVTDALYTENKMNFYPHFPYFLTGGSNNSMHEGYCVMRLTLCNCPENRCIGIPNLFYLGILMKISPVLSTFLLLIVRK